MLHKGIISAIIAFSLASCASVVTHQPILTPGQMAAESLLFHKENPEMVTGEFGNGMKFYIRQNDKPENRVYFRLIIKAGSLQESNIKGIAHYLEHMAFNGTRNYPKNDVVKLFEKMGMTFGQHTNAYTSYDQTVYTLTTPSDDTTMMGSAMKVMVDWIDQGILLNEDDVEGERGVILEEWRQRQLGVQARTMATVLDKIYKNTKYQTHLPIGTEDDIGRISAEDLREYYQKWYQPHNMAIVAVGDIDVEQMRSLFEEHFAYLDNDNNYKATSVKLPRPLSVEDFNLTDKEIVTRGIEWQFPTLMGRSSDFATYEYQVKANIVATLLNRRFADLALDKDPSFRGAASSLSSYFDGTKAFRVSASVIGDGFEKAFKGVERELKRAIELGFSEPEFMRAKESYKASMARMVVNKDKYNSPAFFSRIQNHYLYNMSLVNIPDRVEAINLILDGINLEDVHQAVKELLSPSFAFHMISAPLDDKEQLPDSQALDLWRKQVASTELAIAKEEETLDQLMKELPKVSPVEKEEVIEPLQAHHWVLPNGANVFFKPTTHKNERLLFSAQAKGGYSIISDKDFRNSIEMDSVVAASGIGDLSVSEQRKVLNTAALSISFTAGNLSHGFSGWTDTKDLSLFMQALHLRFTKANILPHILERHKKAIIDFQSKRLSSPAEKFSDEFREFYYQDHPRVKPWQPEFADLLSIDTMQKVHNQWYANASDFNFYFVGDIEPDALKKFVSQFIGSLPAVEGEKSQYKDLGLERLRGQHRFVRDYRNEEKASVSIRYFNDLPKIASQEYLYFDAADQIASVLLRENIREKLTGVYSIGASSWYDTHVRRLVGANIGFTCDEDRIDELLDAVEDTLKELKQGNFDVQLVDNEKQRWLKAYESAQQTNGYWMSVLQSVYEDNLPLDHLGEEKSFIESMTKGDIVRAAQRIFDTSNRTISILRSKTKENNFSETDE